MHPIPGPGRRALAAFAVSAAVAAPAVIGSAVASPAMPRHAAPSGVETVQYYCPPGYRFSYRRNVCVPAAPPPAYYAPPPAYYAPPPPPAYYYRPPPPVYYAPPPPRYYRPPPPPGVGLFFNF